MEKTTSKVIYEAWINTEKPIKYKTTNAKGEEVEKKINFADPEKNNNYDQGYEGYCSVCGDYVHGGIPVKKMLPSSYMDWAIHKKPEATYICKSCSFCLGMNADGRIALFRYTVVAEKVLHLCNKQQIRNFLVNPPDPPFVMILPVSQKKHLFAKSQTSYSKEKFFCNLEETTIMVDRTICELIKKIEALRGVGIKVSSIENGQVPWNILKAYNMQGVENVIRVIEKIRKNPMFELALKVSQKMEGEEAACYLGLTPKMK